MCLDANFASAPGKTEDQNYVWLFRKQFWQLAIHRGVAGGEYASGPMEPGEGRASAADQCLRQNSTRVDGRAREGTEAG